jgi:uncharacterized membrane protein (DUF373 family)
VFAKKDFKVNIAMNFLARTIVLALPKKAELPVATLAFALVVMALQGISAKTKCARMRMV